MEYLPQNAPNPKGRAVQISCFIDADHSGEQITKRSRTGVFIFLNKASIMGDSKRKNTAETSIFRTEYVAMKQAV